MAGQSFPASCDGASGARLRLRSLSSRDNVTSSHQASSVQWLLREPLGRILWTRREAATRRGTGGGGRAAYGAR
jgi:hypothetical protein